MVVAALLRSWVQILVCFFPERGEAAADDTKDRRSGWRRPTTSRTFRTTPVGALPSVSEVVFSRRPKVDGIGAFASVGDQKRLARFWLKSLSLKIVASEPEC